MAGGSGQKRMVINTRERAVSTDENRGLGFTAAYLVDAMHHLFDGVVFGTNGSLNRGNAAQNQIGAAGPIGTPLAGTILGGLMVTCPTGGTELAVTPGAALLADVDGLTGSPEATAHDADDSFAKLVVDRDGILAGSGSLVLTANSSGDIRVDVVELRRKPEVIETANRDIYDETTGLFTSTLVTKVAGAESFEYRIRLGTSGAGLPANVQGWMPICVIGVPDGTTDFDACTLYDVRPLGRDRIGPFTDPDDDAPQAQSNLFTDVLSSATAFDDIRLYGTFKSNIAGYRIGGRLTSVVGGADVDYLELESSSDHYSSDLNKGTPSAPGWRPLWLMFPGGLPRWVRYSKANIAPYGGRIPWTHRGVPVISNTMAANGTGQQAASAIAMPPSSGLDSTTTTAVGVMMATIPVATGGVFAGLIVRNNQFKAVTGIYGVILWVYKVQPPTFEDSDRDLYKLEFGLNAGKIPINAKRVLFSVTRNWTVAAATEGSYLIEISLSPGDDSVSGTPDALALQGQEQVIVYSLAGGVKAVDHIAEVDLPAMRPNQPAYTEHHLWVDWSPSVGLTVVAASGAVTIAGWEI
jgi:hypothetical protein